MLLFSLVFIYNQLRGGTFMKVTRLTKREKVIMEIFLRSEKPLSSNDIHSLAPEISINTIQPNLRKLNERGYLKSPVSDSPGIPSPGNISPSSHRRNISAPFWMRKLLMRLRFPTLKNAMIRSGWKSSGSFWTTSNTNYGTGIDEKYRTAFWIRQNV